ncbi:MAG: radical SAM protein [Christensenellales bacterium]
MRMDSLQPCRLCPRDCGVVRESDRGEGFCGMGTRAVVARAAPHLWEEPCISGSRGTGAVFFSGCTLRCCYCQNWEISHQGRGKALDARELADCFRRLEDGGVHSLSLVTPSHFLPAILDAFKLYRPRIPVVCNTGGYETPETIQALGQVVDVWLPDLKCRSPRLGALLLGAADYFEIASRAVRLMAGLSGPPCYDAEGLMLQGTLVRHLVIPGCVADSREVLRFIADELPDGTPVSLMRQYTPIPQCHVSGLDRRVSAKEYAQVLSTFEALGLQGYAQEMEAADPAYTPPFDLTGL